MADGESMNLLLDGGNTLIKYCWYCSSDSPPPIKQSLSMTYSLAQLRALLSEHVPAYIYVADVSDKLMPLLAQTDFADRCRPVVSEPVILGVTNAYSKPKTLGIDRFLAAVEAYHQCNGPVCVIDLGTAAKVDVVDQYGRHQGGYIVPGLNMSRQVLLDKTAKVRYEREQTENDSLSYGLNTGEAVLNGTLLLLLAWCRQQIDAFYRQYPDGKVLLTGGDRDKLAPHLMANAGQVQLADALVLSALARIAMQAAE